MPGPFLLKFDYGKGFGHDLLGTKVVKFGLDRRSGGYLHLIFL